MRRALLAVALGGVLVTGTACDTDRPISAAAAEPSPTPAASAAPDYSADTRAVCGRLETVFNDDL